MEETELIFKEIAEIKEQLAYSNKLLETLIAESKPCADNSKETMAKLMADFKKSPIGSHPAFKEMFAPLEKMFENK